MAAPTFPELITLAARMRICREDRLLDLVMPSGKTLRDTSREDLHEISNGYLDLESEMAVARRRLADVAPR